MKDYRVAWLTVVDSFSKDEDNLIATIKTYESHGWEFQSHAVHNVDSYGGLLPEKKYSLIFSRSSSRTEG